MGGSSSPRSKPTSRIEEGDKVEADYKGKGRYYPGKITRDRRDGTYDIDYDDGEKETRVDEKLIRPLGGSPKKSSAGKLEEGDKVEADYKGKGRYYPGKITRDRRDGSYDIDYDDGEKETRVDEKLIRLIGGGSASGESKSSSSGGRLEEGDKVEADYKGKGRYYPGKITRDRRDGSYDIDYDDGEKETRVDEKLIRPLGGSPKKSSAGKLEEGDKVEADYKGKGRYYPGKITRDRRDGSYDIDYDDGEKETRVDEKLIRPLDRGRSPPRDDYRDRDRDRDREVRGSGSRRTSRSPESKRGGDSEGTRRKDLSRILSLRVRESIQEVVRRYQTNNDTSCRLLFESMDETPANGHVSKKEFKTAMKTIHQGAGNTRNSRHMAFEDWLEDADLQALSDALTYRRGGSIPYDDFLSFGLDLEEPEELQELHAKLHKEIFKRSKNTGRKKSSTYEPPAYVSLLILILMPTPMLICSLFSYEKQ